MSNQSKNKISCLVSHPTANTVSRYVAEALYKAGLLHSFRTCIATGESSRNPLYRKLFTQRTIDIPDAYIRRKVFREVARLASQRLGCFSSLRAKEGAFLSVDRIYESLDRSVAGTIMRISPSELSAIYAFEDGALHSFKIAREKGIRCIYDMPIAYWQTASSLLKEENDRYPEWAKTMPGLSDSPKKLERKCREIEMADAVVCPSRFVLESLPAHIRERKQCIISHFGCITNPSCVARKTPTEGPLRFLFVGSLTQRKGLADLFEAVRSLNSDNIELVLLGSPVAPIEFYKDQGVSFSYEPARTHKGVLELMSRCDVFVLPSLVEGRALVQLEALGTGLPVIITPNTGGEDLILPDASTGFSVPIRSPESIAEKMEWFLANRGQIDAMKEASREHASSITWTKYQESLVEFIRAFLGEKVWP